MKKILLGITTTSLAITPIATVVSCSNSNGVSTNQVEFNTKTALTIKNRSNEIYNVYQANENPDAIQKLHDFLFNNLTVKNLQKEFNLLLTEFYESYEHENNVSEIEIEKIDVLERIEENNREYSFKLRVWMEKEDEITDEEELISQDIIWKPTIKLISHDEIEEIKQTVSKYTQNQTNNDIDLSDIKEIFFGERDADDFDDYGVFDRLKLFNKDYKNLACLLGYELSLNDIFSQLTVKTRVGVDLNTKFTIPSLILNSKAVLFVPNKKPDIDFTQKPSLTQSTLDTIFANTTIISDKTQIVNTLNQLLLNPITVEDLVGAKDISSIQLIKDTNKYMLVVNYGLSKEMPDLIYFYPSVR